MKAFAIQKIPEFFIEILPAIGVTLEYVILAFVIGLFFGVLLALAKIGNHRILKAIAVAYTTVMRCTPSIVLLFLVYYGLPRVVKSVSGISMDTTAKVKFIVITLALFCTASLSEVFRSAYESLDKGQIEAADSIGMTKIQAFVHVLAPQMLYAAIPNLCNTVLMLLKEGALAYTIGVFDLLGKGNYIIGQHQGAYIIEVYVTLIIIYWPVSVLITKLSETLERRLNFYSESGKKGRVKNA